ncbi:hypothetical protein HDV57DRAFT_449297 [Trichoderma longibrachiatum]
MMQHPLGMLSAWRVVSPPFPVVVNVLSLLLLIPKSKLVVPAFPSFYSSRLFFPSSSTTSSPPFVFYHISLPSLLFLSHCLFHALLQLKTVLVLQLIECTLSLSLVHARRAPD